MAKLILLSALIGTVVLPVRAAREPDPWVGLRKLLKHSLYLHVAYAFALRFLWGRFNG